MASKPQKSNPCSNDHQVVVLNLFAELLEQPQQRLWRGRRKVDCTECLVSIVGRVHIGGDARSRRLDRWERRRFC